MTDPNGLGAQDQCATCSHGRWRHDGEQAGIDTATSCVRADCACGGVFVEISLPTRMAQFVEAGNQLAVAMAGFRQSMTNAARTLNALHAAMQQAGLLPDEEPGLCDGCDTVTDVAATDDGRAQLCASCMRVLGASIEEEARARQTTALQQLTTFHHVDCDKTCDGTCTQEHPADGRDPTARPMLTGMDVMARQAAPGRGPILYPHITPRTQDDLQGPVPDIAELVTAPPRYAQHPSDTCATCYPHACDPDRTGQRRSQCQRPPDPGMPELYCPTCSHPWSYITDGACTMPVLPGTNTPPSRADQNTDRCGCAAQPPAPEWTCEKCGSHQWVGWRNGPAHEGFQRRAQCTPCGHVQDLPVSGRP